jgi:3'-phosphoadenosine 5'-phosphosulfate sulfotransferase (PAPS reductase)/FAD synthetase
MGGIRPTPAGNHFRIDPPAMISFSGGRTSAYMLREVLDAGLPKDVEIIFANTGKERNETLDFVHEIETRWDINVVWIERPKGGGFRRVSYKTASRNGQPFRELIEDRKYLPNPVTRFCTTELKIRPMRNYMRSLGHDDADWQNVVGLRADEPHRVARMRDRNKEARWEVAVPLYDAGKTKDDVDRFWKEQPFDLRLLPYEGNCDLCFLKGINKKIRIIERRPDLASWWIEMEKKIGKTFRIDTPPYARLYDRATRQLRMFDDACDVDTLDCFCTD